MSVCLILSNNFLHLPGFALLGLSMLFVAGKAHRADPWIWILLAWSMDKKRMEQQLNSSCLFFAAMDI